MTNLEKFLEYLVEVKNYKPISTKKLNILLSKVETGLGKPILDIQAASEVEKAILKASELRKRVYNGGTFDEDGQHTKFRMGIAVAQYTRWAHGEGLMAKNPYSRNTFRQPPKRESGWLTDTDIESIYNNAKLTVFDHALVRFLIDTGMRREELLKCKMADVDFNERIVHIPDAKCDGFRRVPFTERTSFWLETYLSMRNVKSDYLFCSNDGLKVGYQALGNYFGFISQKVGFRVHPHKLRHTAGRIWAEGGINQGIIMRFMGHVDPKVTAGYIHTSGKQLRELQEKVYAGNRVLAGK